MTLQERIRLLELPAVLGEAKSAKDWPARRRQLINLLSEHEYGFTPPPAPVTAAESLRMEHACADKAVRWTAELTLHLPGGEFTFPVQMALPKQSPCPVFVLLNFRPGIPDDYLPLEELIDRGYGVAMICYQDVTGDNDDMTNGLAGCFGLDKRDASGMGKIGCWAYAASRCLDYLLTLPAVDPHRIAVVGHSRLGKTALWCGAQDERFAAVFGNDSGAGGDAIARNKIGETVADLCLRFPYWFCEKYRTYADREKEMPLDQHFLLAACAPRPVAICTAQLDVWADPEAGLLSCMAASPAYELLGLEGCTGLAYPAVPGTALTDGRIGYFLRTGSHYFSRADWDCYIRFWEQKR